MTHATNPLTIFYEVALRSFTFDFTRYIIAALLVGGIVWIMGRTALATRKLQARKAAAADMRREFLQSVRSCVVYIGVTVVIVWLMNMGIVHKIGSGPSLGWATNLAFFVGMIIAHDAYFYWTHRAMHLPLFYKRFHLAHHRSVTPTPFAIYSFSVEEAVINAGFVLLWQIFFGTPGWVFIAFMLFQVTRNAMGHAGYELMPRWWLASPLTRWINTTTHHDLHHSGGFGHNYGLYFTWWDKLMGTEHPRYHAEFARVTAAAAPAPGRATGDVAAA